MMEYNLTHKGLATSNGVEMGAFVRSPLAGDEPDIQIHFLPAFMIDHGRDPGPGHGFMLHACNLRPRSRGRIRLWSADPTADPRIEPNYLSDEQDMKVLIESIRLCRRIFAQPAFNPYRGKEFMPGEEAQSDEQIAAAIRRTAETIYHPVGTCKMGAASDKMAVVDNQCRVHGLQGLRVVDASVFPELMGGNTNAPTIMVAEKIAATLA
jgi:choline dehydrogenase